MSKSLISDTKAELSYLLVLPIMIIVSLLVISSLGTVLPSSITSHEQATTGIAASGTLTFSGNVSCNEIVNITNAAGNTAVFRFNISQISAVNEGYCGATIPEYATVNINQMWNTSGAAAQNLTTAINNNATISGTMTATVSGNIVTLKYNTVGLTGNKVATSKQVANALWSGSTLTKGEYQALTWDSGTRNTMTAAPTFLTMDYLFVYVIVLLASIALVIKVIG